MASRPATLEDLKASADANLVSLKVLTVLRSYFASTVS
jgi:hypothetical protein